jgi:YbbR domain-containing protein
VRASQEAWSLIKPEEFKASVDLAKQGSGIHSLDPKVESSGDYQVVDWEPKRVTVRLEPLAQVTVPVQLRMTGKLADGYLLRSQTITPDQVTVTGEQDLVQTVTQVAISLNLEGINGNVTQDVTPTPLDLSGAKADINRTTTLTAGSGYSITSAPDVQVSAAIQPLRSTEVLPIGIAAQGVPAGLEAKLSSPTVEVTISGLVPALSALKPGDIAAVVNVGGLAPGQYTLPVRLNAPAAVSLDAANPATVAVTLEPPATPTPAPPSSSPVSSAPASPPASAAASPTSSASPSASTGSSGSPAVSPTASR